MGGATRGMPGRWYLGEPMRGSHLATGMGISPLLLSLSLVQVNVDGTFSPVYNIDHEEGNHFSRFLSSLSRC